MIDFDAMAREHDERVAARRADPRPLLYVVNCHHPIHMWPTPRWHYIGRPMPHRSVNYIGSSLGNPFRPQRNDPHGLDHALLAYRHWLWERMKDPRSQQSRELREVLGYALGLDGVSLGCWCAPRACHGDVVKRAVEWLWSDGVRPDGWTVESSR